MTNVGRVATIVLGIATLILSILASGQRERTVSVGRRSALTMPCSCFAIWTRLMVSMTNRRPSTRGRASQRFAGSSSA